MCCSVDQRHSLHQSVVLLTLKDESNVSNQKLIFMQFFCIVGGFYTIVLLRMCEIICEIIIIKKRLQAKASMANHKALSEI